MKKILSFVGASLVLAGAMFVTSCQDPKEYELSDIKTDTIVSLDSVSDLTASSSYGSRLQGTPCLLYRTRRQRFQAPP